MGDAFNPIDPMVQLRLVCGLFFIPHIAGKVLPPHPALSFFKAAGFPAPGPVMYFAALVETLTCIGLVLGIQTRLAAWLGVGILLVAAIAVYRLQGILDKPKWLWNVGGCEYPLFWALACGILAMSGPV